MGYYFFKEHPKKNYKEINDWSLYKITEIYEKIKSNKINLISLVDNDVEIEIK